MNWFHGTSQEKYQEIIKEGFIWGKRDAPSRCTYLTPDAIEAQQYGDVVLKIDYEPYSEKYCNNYTEGCWQVREYNPIPISKILEAKVRGEK
jgi:RNA:NAD 2'-phosphotransferase (TPT1/KptA family)